jgi:hypothetical protein
MKARQFHQLNSAELRELGEHMATCLVQWLTTHHVADAGRFRSSILMRTFERALRNEHALASRRRMAVKPDGPDAA